MAKNEPVPGPTQSPGPSASPPSGNSGLSFEALQQFASMWQAPSGNQKPSTAFERYGPLSGNRNMERAGEQLGISAQTPITRNVADFIKDYYRWPTEQQLKFRNQLALLDKSALTATDDQIASAWASYVQQSANHLDAGQALSPWDILAKDIAVRGQGGSLAGTKTRTTTDTSLTSQADAAAIFRTAAQSLLGRAPTTEEINQFRANLNSQERANPVTSTITTTTNEQGEVVNESRTSQGGISAAGAADIAKEKAKLNPEYGAYQAATTYHNAMMQLIMRGY